MKLQVDLRQGFGDFKDYKLFKFPDGSIKFQLKEVYSDIDWEDDYLEGINIITTFRNSDDILILGLVSEQLAYNYGLPIGCLITYMMYQQDDRRFSERESFGLQFISRILNSYPISYWSIFHPHSDKVEFIENLKILDNTDFIKSSIEEIQESKGDLIPLIWVIPDSGAFKTQFKQIEKLKYPEFITCMKSRDHQTGDITTIVNTEDLRGKDCFIVDDICLGGRTFIGIAEELKKKNCGRLYLVVSHGVFNTGIDHLLEYFEAIYTTDSICTLEESDKLNLYPLEMA